MKNIKDKLNKTYTETVTAIQTQTLTGLVKMFDDYILFGEENLIHGFNKPTHAELSIFFASEDLVDPSLEGRLVNAVAQLAAQTTTFPRRFLAKFLVNNSPGQTGVSLCYEDLRSIILNTKNHTMHIITPSALYLTALQLRDNKVHPSGKTNELYKTFDVIHLPELNENPTTWYTVGSTNPANQPFSMYFMSQKSSCKGPKSGLIMKADIWSTIAKADFVSIHKFRT